MLFRGDIVLELVLSDVVELQPEIMMRGRNISHQNEYEDDASWQRQTPLIIISETWSSFLKMKPAIFPLKVDPHHDPKLHVRHHHVLKADQGIFDGEEFSKEKKLF